MSDQSEDTEAYLTRHRDALQSRDDGPAGVHLDDERLAAVVELRAPLRAEERTHLAACAECRAVLAEVGREQPAPVIPIFRRRPVWIAAAAAVAAVALLAINVPALLPRDELQARGRGSNADVAEPEASGVALVAVDAAGVRRDLASGARATLSDQLGFRYGNTSGARRTLSILGWNGGHVHWYYPESAAGAPIALESGQAARAVRLPFDIALAERHVAGPLTVVAGFDLDPRSIARALESGEDPRALGPNVEVIELELAGEVR